MLRIRAVVLFMVSLASAVCAAAGDERLLVNGKVFTADPSRPYAEAVAIRGDTIMAVGSRAEASAAVGAGAETIDLGGRFLMPGLIDSHC
ncbi:MAG: amidohydrolase, partial [Gammaproteobacteria bacterium]|nr:amidohydrolase [Gammaproteobacteria bacterium]